VDVAPALKGVRTATARRRFFGLGHALVVAQIALSLLLVIGAGLFVRTLSNLESIDLGFNRENVLLFSMVARQAGYSDEALARLYESLRTQLAAVPGVRRLSLSDMALVSGMMSAGGVSIPGMDSARTESSFMSVGPDSSPRWEFRWCSAVRSTSVTRQIPGRLWWSMRCSSRNTSVGRIHWAADWHGHGSV